MGAIDAVSFSQASFLGGAALAAPNFAAGALAGFVLGMLLRSAAHLGRGT